MKMNTKLLGLYALKFNPFSSEVPLEALYVHPKLESFCWRVEHTLMHEGGFALVSGDPGTGKSVALRVLSSKLNTMRDVQVGAVTHPSANLADFYRELGDIFNVPLSAQNRWHGFKHLREYWIHHLEKTLLRPVLFVDEAQEMPACVLNELRLLSSAQYDSRTLLSVILAGDERLNHKLRNAELVPLGSRIRLRFNNEHASPEQLLHTLQHLLESAGSPHLMTPELMQMLCEHSMGNYRALCTMSNELLSVALTQDKAQLDEALYFECFSKTTASKRKKT